MNHEKSLPKNGIAHAQPSCRLTEHPILSVAVEPKLLRVLHSLQGLPPSLHVAIRARHPPVASPLASCAVDASSSTAPLLPRKLKPRGHHFATTSSQLGWTSQRHSFGTIERRSLAGPCLCEMRAQASARSWSTLGQSDPVMTALGEDEQP